MKPAQLDLRTWARAKIDRMIDHSELCGRKVMRQANLDRQDLGAVHFPDDSTTEEGHSSTGAT